MREAREAASLGNAGTPATVPPPAASAPAAAPAAPAPAAARSQDSIEAAINAVIRLPQRQPGTAEVPGVITPLSQSLPSVPPLPVTPVEAASPAPEPEPEPVVVPEPVVPEPVVPEPVVPEPVVPEPVVPEPVVPEPVVPEPVSPIPVAATSFHILDSQAPMPELVPEESTIFASMKSNWFSSVGDSQQPWSSNEIDSGWEAADRVAEATPIQVTEAGLPVRRPGSRIVPGGVKPAVASVVRDPEAIRARLAAHAAGVNRGRRVAGGPDLDSNHSEHSTQKESDPA